MSDPDVTPRTLVLDDHFPVLSSGFRVAEFTQLMRAGLVDSVLTTMGPFESTLAPFAEQYRDLADRVLPFDAGLLDGYGQAYVIFLNNAHFYLEHLERAQLPFILTLYPGGGLDGSDESRAKLDRVLGSPLLRRVITTQPHVSAMVRRDYPGVEEVQLTGLFVNDLYFQPGAGERENYFGTGKPTLDLCFVAHKYTVGGRDKGFPEFVLALAELRRRKIPAHGHVVGEFDEADVAEFGSPEDVTLHGVLDSRQLRELYLTMDAIVSPNRPGVLAHGAFDGFPLASCVEAALCGVAMVMTDHLRQSTFLRDGRDALIVEADADRISDRLEELLREPGGLRRVARSGLRKVRYVYSPPRQVDLRAPLIRGHGVAQVPR